MKKLAYYITAHGYGHGSRSCDILNALHALAPELHIVVKTDLPTQFMKSRLSNGIELRPGAFDTGLAQKDSIKVDLTASLEAIQNLYAKEEVLIRQEMDFMVRENIGVVVADIPAIPLAAAQKAGIPNIATGNFGWDWIYAEFAERDPRWQPYAEKIRRVYEQTGLLLRQPFAESMEAFPCKVDLPLLAKSGTGCRPRIVETTGADPARQWVLLSFTALDLDPSALENLAKIRNVAWFSVEPLAWPESCVHSIARATAPFADILASMDVVVSKPGFGIISECIANKKPLIYSDRADFREYAVLVKDIRRYCRHAFIPNAELYAGELGHALEQIETVPPPPETIDRGGAELAARKILEHLQA